jgi:hypothetical protein
MPRNRIADTRRTRPPITGTEPNLLGCFTAGPTTPPSHGHGAPLILKHLAAGAQHCAATSWTVHDFLLGGWFPLLRLHGMTCSLTYGCQIGSRRCRGQDRLQSEPPVQNVDLSTKPPTSEAESPLPHRATDMPDRPIDYRPHRSLPPRRGVVSFDRFLQNQRGTMTAWGRRRGRIHSRRAVLIENGSRNSRRNPFASARIPWTIPSSIRTRSVEKTLLKRSGWRWCCRYSTRRSLRQSPPRIAWRFMITQPQWQSTHSANYRRLAKLPDTAGRVRGL